ncbi:MAG: hybrid sensor histidine kinase/response regulator [Anaerolineae bacterium]|nr:hybrid sensor histidine kinase/response regulator [Anaerolineae bacterium]NUQ06246.1 hybrid sensor histidine kinase/response regulator [Anaerolineae bacterium]
MIPSQATVLIVDDEPMNVTILEDLFSRYYRTLSAHRGQEALNIIAREPIDLVLLDIMMPGMTGLQVLDTLRKTPETADLPVILVSARTEERDIVQGLNIGANDYIVKPFKMAEMLARARTQIAIKMLQDERKRTIEELRRLHEVKDHFFRIASHDLKGPLGNLRLAIYLLRHQSVDAETMELLDNADLNINTMQNVIAEFLDSAALQSGEISLNVSPVDLTQAITEQVRQYSMFALKKEIALNLVNPAGVIYGDPGRFGQALGNLISNAIKYSPHGSEVTIWTDDLGESVRVCVADQGPGIPEQERARLFTQFGKLTPRPTEGESSTGLGLWITKVLVNLQRGEVGVHSPPEGGSIFWIEMPTNPVSALG